MNQLNTALPIYVAVHGQSIAQLDERIEWFRGKGGYWATVNRWWTIQPILDKIGARFNFLYASAKGFEEYQDRIEEFLIQPNRPILFTSQAFFDVSPKLRDFLNNQIVISELASGHLRYPELRAWNSLMALLLILLDIGFREIYLFGADGGGNYCDARGDSNAKGLLEDSFIISERFWLEAKALGVSNQDARIINVCPESVIECFERVGYHEVCK